MAQKCLLVLGLVLVIVLCFHALHGKWLLSSPTIVWRPVSATLKGKTIICVICSAGEHVPSAPVSFAARFGPRTFLSSSAPVSLTDPPPDPIQGMYSWVVDNGREGTLTMWRPEEDARSVLHLVFDTPSAGVLCGQMYSAKDIVATQCGAFHLVSSKTYYSAR